MKRVLLFILPLSPLILATELWLDVRLLGASGATVVMVFTLLSLILYVREVVLNTEIDSTSKTAWILVVVLLGSIGQLVYWGKFVYNIKPKKLQET